MVAKMFSSDAEISKSDWERNRAKNKDTLDTLAFMEILINGTSRSCPKEEEGRPLSVES